MSKKFFIVITGPTGVGKTSIINQISEKINCSVEIVNADVGQFYKPFSIGTAKPDWKEEKASHYLFDYISEPTNFTVFEYRAVVKKLLEDMWARNVLPIVVGGSGFYLKSLFFPPEKNQESILEGNYKVEIDDKSTESLWRALKELDPQRAKMLHPHDRYRIERALVLYKKTGTLPSEYRPVFTPLSNFYMLFLTRDRQELYDRINERVEIMMHQGWVEEVQKLNAKWRDFLKQKKLIGYPEIIKYLENQKKNEHALVEEIQQKTRRYAKRQITFWKSFKRQLETCLKSCDTRGIVREVAIEEKGHEKLVAELSQIFSKYC